MRIRKRIDFYRNVLEDMIDDDSKEQWDPGGWSYLLWMLHDYLVFTTYDEWKDDRLPEDTILFKSLLERFNALDKPKELIESEGYKNFVWRLEYATKERF